jgi:hypothetical protein
MIMFILIVFLVFSAHNLPLLLWATADFKRAFKRK